MGFRTQTRICRATALETEDFEAGAVQRIGELDAKFSGRKISDPANFGYRFKIRTAGNDDNS